MRVEPFQPVTWIWWKRHVRIDINESSHRASRTKPHKERREPAEQVHCANILQAPVDTNRISIKTTRLNKNAKKDQMAVLSFFLLCFHHRHEGFGFGDTDIIRKEKLVSERQLTFPRKCTKALHRWNVDGTKAGDQTRSRSLFAEVKYCDAEIDYSSVAGCCRGSPCRDQWELRVAIITDQTDSPRESKARHGMMEYMNGNQRVLLTVNGTRRVEYRLLGIPISLDSPHHVRKMIGIFISKRLYYAKTAPSDPRHF